MATTYPLPTLAAVVNTTGISAPPYSDIYQSLQASFKSIYGTDAYIDPDSQDGQLLAVFAQAIADSNDTAIAVYNKFAPGTATGSGLSSQVKINGISRAIATKGTVAIRVIGQIGTVITAGVVSDPAGNRWLLPATVTIPPAGQIDVTATAEKVGFIEALAGTITQMVNPQLGWQSATNTSDAAPGAAVETDGALQRRQAFSTALPSRTILEGTVAAIAQLPGVTQVRVYENDTDTTDANGLQRKSIAAVVLGGVALGIATAIANKKTPGAYTNGTTLVTVTDDNGMPSNIRFYYAASTPLAVNITVKAGTGYTTAIGTRIKQTVADFINGLGIGRKSDLGKLYLPAQFFGGVDSDKFEIDGITQAIKPASPTAADVVIAFNARATLALADITLTVT